MTSSNVVGGVNDLIGLTHLHEPAILHALRLRYNEDIIYTATGPILIAVNPFKSMTGLYDDSVMDEYRCKGESSQIKSSSKSSKKKGEDDEENNKLAPHVFQTADDAYRAMMLALEMTMMSQRSMNQNHDRIPAADQSILVSGESGAGKTVTTKIVLNYFAMLSKRKSEGRAIKNSTTTPIHKNSRRGKANGVQNNNSVKNSNDRNIEQQVLQSNPILESFGNARTIRNDNSSRFGKYIDVRFTTRGKLSGASIETYLLEKVRLVHPGSGERNYHIFYQFLDAVDRKQRKNLHLGQLTKYDFHILSQTNTFDRRDGVSDRQKHNEMIEAMETVGFDPETIDNLIRLLTAILFAGNMKFTRVEDPHHESCTLDCNDDSNTAASLLGISFEDLASSLTSRKISAGLEQFEKLLSLEQATKGLAALMKAIYGAAFDFVVKLINLSIIDEDDAYNENDQNNRWDGGNGDRNKGVASIGVLDIFGFESFATNGFEQICINYTNEALQQQFNKFVFKLEQLEYQNEGILWEFISFPDNQDVLDLIELKHIGILAILDEQCIVPQSSDQKFTRCLYAKCGEHDRFKATSTQKVNFLFSIKHYAGEVEYTADNWLEKNKDELPAGSAELLKNSKFSFLTEELQQFFRLERKKTPGRQKMSSLVTKSVGAQFAEQLRSLRSRIDLTIPHYIRCLKPNDDLVPNRFVPKNVVEQLRCGGVLEAVRVSRAGYPTRYPHDIFIDRYSVLMEDITNVSDGASILSSWTNFSSKEQNLKNLVAKIAFDIWVEEHQMMLNKMKAEERRRNGSGSKFRKATFPSKTKAEFNKKDEKIDRPETPEEYLALDFASRCAVAGLQLGKSKVFLRREAFERIEAMRSRMYFDAPSKIQAIYRQYIQRQQFLDMKIAAILAQSIIRMGLARKKTRHLLITRKVTLIQSAWRRAIIRHTVWSCYIELKEAATTIQRFYRFKYKNKSQSDSATTIQAWFRGMITRIEVSRTLVSIVKIQALVRGSRARFKVLNVTDESNVKSIMRARLERASSTSSVTMTPRKKDVKNAPFKIHPNVKVKKTVLYNLIQEEKWAAVESTLDKHPKLAESVEPSSGELPLHIIARHRNAWTLLVDMVLVLYPKALVFRDRMGALPIHHAAAHDNVAALEIIHSAYKEGINEADYQGRLPIHIAAEFDAVETVKYLLAKAPEGAYTMIQNRKAVNGGGLPLHAACRNYASIGVITAFLAENFASAKKTDINGDLPLHLLLRCGDSVDQVVVKTLLTCFSGAVTRTDMYGDLPLSIALKHGCKSSVVNTILIQYPSAATIVTTEGHTPLFLAFQHGAEDRTILGLLNHAPELATVIDEKTSMLPIQLATQNEHSPFIVHNLLRRDMPIDMQEKVRAQLLPHNYSWNHIVNDTNDMYHMVVNKLLQQCTQPQVLALAHVEGPDGQIALASATPVCKHELRVMLRLFNTLEVVNQRPAYTNPDSDTQIFYALRYDPPPTQNNNFTLLHEDKREEGYSNIVEEFDDTSLYSGTSMSSALSSLSGRSQQSVSDKLRRIRKEKGQQVIAKLTSRADVVERELKVRKDFHLSRHYVPAIISVHHTVQHAAYSEAMAEPGYCITMEGADTTAENLILDIRKSGKKFPTKALKRIGIALLHMHEHGVVHGDFGTHNIGKFGSRWKLLGVGASIPIGHNTNTNRGFYHPPESIFVESKRSHLGKKSVNASVRSIIAQTSYDIWAYGVVLYEAIAGFPLSPYACRGKREMTTSEIAKIGKWDEHSIKKALRAMETDDEIAKDLLRMLLHGDPKKRCITMRDVLEHTYFAREKTERTERHKKSSHQRSRNVPDSYQKHSSSTREREFFDDFKERTHPVAPRTDYITSSPPPNRRKSQDEHKYSYDETNGQGNVHQYQAVSPNTSVDSKSSKRSLKGFRRNLRSRLRHEQS